MNAPDRITEIFDQYVESFRQGSGDPTPFLERLQGDDRRELELLIDAFLETGPKARLDPATESDPEIEAVTASVMKRFEGRTGALSQVVLKLRVALGLKQADVVERLGEELDADPGELEKIDRYYHALEWGSLPAAGIGEPVYAALARILRTGTAELREAAFELGPGRASATGPVFARTADDADFELAAGEDAGRVEAGFTDRVENPDRIDRLFTGGG